MFRSGLRARRCERHAAKVCFSWSFALLVTSCSALLGCGQDDSPPAEVEEALPPRGAKSGQQSPNARILPDPLEESGGPADADDNGEDDLPEAPRPRPKPDRWPLSTAVVEEPYSGGPLTGYVAEARIIWPEAERRKSHNRIDYELWPVLRLEFVRETRERPALARWVINSPVFALPQGAELRSRVDRLGMLMVWPDQRSYRVVQQGALRAVFEDRRVDKVPFVDVVHTDSGVGTRLGRPTVRMKLVSTLGVAHLELLDLPDLPYASQLFCRQLLEFIRVLGRVEICRKQLLPVRMYVEWAKGGQFLFEMMELGAVSDLASSNFRIPPTLPIFKRGELPPFDQQVFSPRVRAELLPLKKPGEPLAPDPVRVPSSPAHAGPAVEAPDPASLLPADMMVFHNLTQAPLLVILQKIPAFWLFPGQVERLRVVSSPIHVIARDFFGQIVLDQGTLSAPKEVRFSAPGAPVRPP